MMMYVLFASILAVIQPIYGQILTTSSHNVSTTTTSYPWFVDTTLSPSDGPTESPSENPSPGPTASPTLRLVTGEPSASPSPSPTISTTSTTRTTQGADTMPATFVTDSPSGSISPRPTPSPTYPVTEPTPAPSESTHSPTQKKDPQPASVVTPEPTPQTTEEPVTTQDGSSTTEDDANDEKTYIIHAECTLYEYDTTKCEYGDDHKHSYRHEYFAKAHDLNNHKPVCGDRMLATGKIGAETCGKGTLHPRDLYKKYTCDVYCNTNDGRYEFKFEEEDSFATRYSIGMSVMIAAVMAYMFM